MNFIQANLRCTLFSEKKNCHFPVYSLKVFEICTICGIYFRQLFSPFAKYMNTYLVKHSHTKNYSWTLQLLSCTLVRWLNIHICISYTVLTGSEILQNNKVAVFKSTYTCRWACYCNYLMVLSIGHWSQSSQFQHIVNKGTWGISLME